MTSEAARRASRAMERSMRNGRRSSHGFTYVALLMVIALIGFAASASVSVGSVVARRDAELQLLVIGMEYQRALRSYAGVPADLTTPSLGRGPRMLEELLRDPRAPGIRRHLRQLYPDPLTGLNEWGLVRDAQG